MPPTLVTMENEVVVAVGATAKVKANPSFELRGTVAVAVDVMAKSDARPKEAPNEPDTAIVHDMALPTRAGFMLVHNKLEEVVGIP